MAKAIIPKSKPIRLRGRVFSKKDLKIIERCVTKYFDKGRTKISKAICEKLGWTQPNGWPKDRACRDVLLKLQEDSLIKLPPKKTKPTTKKKGKKVIQSRVEPETYHIRTFPKEIDFELAKGNRAEKIWNQLMREHHYIGHTVLVGRCIKYLVKGDGQIIAALAFSSPSWQLDSRDTVLSELGIESQDRRDLVINNSRFLMLPHLKIKNLASTVLSLATEKIVADWRDYYSITPLVAETFVQPSLYLGTCYKAANWIGLGLTKGYAKVGSAHHNGQEPKQLYLYGLNKKMRKKIATAIKTIEKVKGKQ